MMIKSAQKIVSDIRGLAAVEAALLLPTLIVMGVSIVDIGNAFLVNQKLIAATQGMADLITRETNPSLEQRAQAITSASQAIRPYPTDTFEYNITSFEFDAGGVADTVWEETSGISLTGSMTSNLSELGGPGEGVVAVRTTYTYRPFFTGFVIGEIPMEEHAFLRGRRSPVVGEPL
jgi:Flp pilus assembly protein TadG